MSDTQKYVLRHRRAPGDIIMMTALVRDIKAAYPDIVLDVDSTCKELWDNNPYLSEKPLWNHNVRDPKITVPGTRFVNCNYGQGIKDQTKETVHFVNYFQRDFIFKTGLKDVKLTLPYGDIHLTEHERTVRPVTGRYWVLLSGGKTDFTIKVWHTKSFQSVIWQLRDRGIQVVQLGDNGKEHWHPNLAGTLDLRGRTTLRNMLQMIQHSDGVICGVTAAMHMAAALGRPCVCIAGGREAYWWEAYVKENSGLGGLDIAAKLKMPHRFLHTIGLLDCCMYHGCWKNKVVKISDDNLLCKYPIHTPDMPVAKCMHIITPRHVIDAVMSYYQDKSLPPIDMPAITELEPSVIHNRQEESTLTVSSAVTLRTDIRQVNRGIAVRPGLANTPDIPSMDHKDVGGRFTICVLFYGGEQFFDLHKRCIESILSTVPQDRVDIRVASNQLNDKSVAMLDAYVAQKLITVHYRYQHNAMKYPVMRDMFFDKALPIKTKWVIWFDDDSICDKNPEWLQLLSQHIVMHHKSGNHMFGARLTWTLSAAQRTVFQSRGWYTGRPWQNSGGKTVQGGTKITFATGGFWAITREAIVKCDIPDLTTGLTHNGGDWQIGCQLYQQGLGLKQFNGSKQFVNTSSVPRRGITVPVINGPAPVVTHSPAQLVIPVRPQQRIAQEQSPPAQPGAVLVAKPGLILL